MSGDFTKGPWRPGFKNIGHVTAENGAVIAKCERLTSLVNVQANARLIAAAPELLEELTMILESFGGGRVMTFSDDDMVRIAALVAKATT